MKPHNPPPISHVPVYRNPPRSGNEINGQGEQQRRRATHVFHSSPAYGPYPWLLMNRFFRATQSFGEIIEGLQLRWVMRDSEGPVAGTRRLVPDPSAMSAEVKATARRHGAGIVGITAMTFEAQYSHANVDYPHAVVIGIPMDRERMQYVPQSRASREVIRVYKEVCKTTVKLAAWIRAQGWRARAYSDPGSTEILQIPLAVNAGLGELGKHGSLICREYGSNVRLGTVVTDLPLAYDTLVDIGAEDLCRHCQRCTTDCPPQAIFDTKQWVRGDYKWYVDFDRCVPYFSITGGCAICIEVCPFSEEGRGPKLSEQLLRRRAARAPAAAPPD